MTDLKDAYKADADGDGIPDAAEEKVSVPEEQKQQYDKRFGDKSFWKDKPFGRTLTLRNKTGKTIFGGLVTYGLSFIPGPVGQVVHTGFQLLTQTQTGVGMELLEMSFLQMLITAAPIIVGLVVSYFFPTIKEHAVWKTIDGRLDDVADEVVRAVDEDSEKGKKITRNELKAIIGSALKKEDLQQQ